MDELTHSRYNIKLKGKLRLIKANLLMYLEEIIKNMENERWKEDIGAKHKNIAKMDGIVMIYILIIQFVMSKGTT